MAALYLHKRCFIDQAGEMVGYGNIIICLIRTEKEYPLFEYLQRDSRLSHMI